MRSVFGRDQEYPCKVCGGMPDNDCICPECPECGDHGNPECYEKHGLKRFSAQIEQLARKTKEWEEAAEAEEKAYEEFMTEEQMLKEG